MAVLIVREARALDGLAVEDRWTGRAFGQFAHQVARSEALTFEDAGELVAVAGIFDGEECWFAAGPACRKNLLRLVRALREVLARAAAMAPGQALTAYVEEGGVAGGRLAAMLGFTETAPTDSPIGTLRTFRRVL